MTVRNRKETDGNRGPNGRFRKGCASGPGRPSGRQAAEAWRTAFAQAVDPGEIAAVVRRLIQLALDGERWAVETLLDRTVGRPGDTDLEERLVELEKLIQERIGQ